MPLQSGFLRQEPAPFHPSSRRGHAQAHHAVGDLAGGGAIGVAEPGRARDPVAGRRGRHRQDQIRRAHLGRAVRGVAHLAEDANPHFAGLLREGLDLDGDRRERRRAGHCPQVAHQGVPLAVGDEFVEAHGPGLAGGVVLEVEEVVGGGGAQAQRAVFKEETGGVGDGGVHAAQTPLHAPAGRGRGEAQRIAVARDPSLAVRVADPARLGAPGRRGVQRRPPAPVEEILRDCRGGGQREAEYSRPELHRRSPAGPLSSGALLLLRADQVGEGLDRLERLGRDVGLFEVDLEHLLHGHD